MSKTNKISSILLILKQSLTISILLLFLFFSVHLILKDDNVKLHNNKFIGVVNINEVITQPFVDRLIGNIRKRNDDPLMLGILFVFNSPGGDPSASSNLMEYIKKKSETTHTWGYINTNCTSGCYYSAIGLKSLSINKNATVGSVGVIFNFIDLSGFSKNIGISEKNIVVGDYKKMFSNSTGITAKNEEYIKKQLLSPVYQNFIDDVISHRSIEGNRIDIISKYFNGKLFVGNDPAIKGILIDNVVDFYTFKQDIKKSVSDFPRSINFVNINKNNETFDLLNTLKQKINIQNKNFNIR